MLASDLEIVELVEKFIFLRDYLLLLLVVESLSEVVMEPRLPVERYCLKLPMLASQV
jgi:hypothetical protein